MDTTDKFTPMKLEINEEIIVAQFPHDFYKPRFCVSAETALNILRLNGCEVEFFPAAHLIQFRKNFMIPAGGAMLTAGIEGADYFELETIFLYYAASLRRKQWEENHTGE